MSARMEGLTAFVTGAGRGIGRAIALALASEGARLTLVARTAKDLEAVRAEVEKMGGSAMAIPADVSVEEEVVSAVRRAAEKFSTIDILINNAGIGSFANVAELAVKDFDRMWEVNMRGVFLCTREILPYMVRKRSGDIVNLASLAGRNAFAGGGGYCSTKWALIGFSRCLMLEVREHNIRVVTLCPGSVETGFGDHPNAKENPAIPKPGDIARVAIDTLLMPRHVMVSEVDIRPTNPKG